MPSIAEQSIVVPGADVPLDIDDLKAQIAAELASQLIDAQGVMDKYGLTSSQWDQLRTNPIFRSMVADAMRTWSGEMNAGQRITKKAEIVLEDAIPVLDRLLHDPQVTPATRIEAIKQVESITGRKNKEAANGMGGGGGFVLNINVGSEEKVVIEGKSTLVAQSG